MNCTQNKDGIYGLKVTNDAEIVPPCSVESVVVIESRDRDRNLYPSANNFWVKLPLHLKAVRTVELMGVFMPHVIGNTENYVVISLGRSAANYAVNQAINSSSMPSDAIGFIPLDTTVGATKTWWLPSYTDRKISHFDPPISEINGFQIGVWVWGGVGIGPPLPYPYPSMQRYALPDEPVALATVPANNILLSISITHERV